MKITLSLALAGIFLLLVSKGSYSQATNSPFIALQKDFLLQTPAGKILDQTVVIKSNYPSQQTVNLNWQGYLLNKDEIADGAILNNHSIDFETLPQYRLTIEPFGVMSLPVSFNAIETLKAGDYYGTLVIANEGHQEKVNFTVRVLGTLKEDVYLKSFSDNGKTTTLELENLGNRTSKITIATTTTAFFAKEFTLQSSFELKSGEQKIVKQDHERFLPGFYQAKVATSFGVKNTTVTKIYSFWVKGEFFIFSLLSLLAAFIIFFGVRKTYRDV